MDKYGSDPPTTDQPDGQLKRLQVVCERLARELQILKESQEEEIQRLTEHYEDALEDLELSVETHEDNHQKMILVIQEKDTYIASLETEWDNYKNEKGTYIARVQEENRILLSKLQTSEIEAQKLFKEVDSLRSQKTELFHDKSDEKVEIINALLEESRKDNDRLQAQLRQVRETLSFEQERNRKLEEQHKTLEATRLQLMNEVALLRNQNEGYLTALHEMEAKLNKAAPPEEVQRLMKEIHHLRSSVHLHVVEKEMLEEELVQTKKGHQTQHRHHQPHDNPKKTSPTKTWTFETIPAPRPRPAAYEAPFSPLDGGTDRPSALYARAPTPTEPAVSRLDFDTTRHTKPNPSHYTESGTVFTTQRHNQHTPPLSMASVTPSGIYTSASRAHPIRPSIISTSTAQNTPPSDSYRRRLESLIEMNQTVHSEIQTLRSHIAHTTSPALAGFRSSMHNSAD